MRAARCGDGEACALFGRNPRIADPVTLDVTLYEADQFAARAVGWSPLTLASDGVILDDYRNPASYTKLKYHPGSPLIGTSFESEQIRAADVIHWFRAERPGQLRGVPELTPALPLFAQLRRYTLAVIAAAEVAADHAAVIQSNSPVGDPDEWEPLDTIELEKRMATVLPGGCTLAQMRAEQPTTTYEMFKRAILQEIARCLCVLYDVAAGDSSTYNYSSGRLDSQNYYKSRAVDRAECEAVVLSRVMARWWNEYRLVNVKSLPPELSGSRQPPPTVWRWPGDEYVDPTKEAEAAVTLIEAGLETESGWQAKRGNDWEAVQIQRAAELGMTLDDYRAALRGTLFAPKGAAPPRSNPAPEKQ